MTAIHVDNGAAHDALMVALDQHLEKFLWNAAHADHHRRAIASINTALAQIRAGTYGNCTGCDRQIKTERLLRDPETSTCPDCAAHRTLIG